MTGVIRLFLALALLPVAAVAGEIEGHVSLPDDSFAAAVKPRYPLAATYEVGEPDAPAAVVFLELSAEPPPEAPSAVLAQERYRFSPGLLAIRRGTVVHFPNRDDEYHSVFSYSKPKRFDLGRYHEDETAAAIEFDQPGVVKLYCEIHDHMRGTIVVAPGPYFAKTDDAGGYRIRDVPAGEHVVKAWVDDEMRERRVTIPVEGTVVVDFPEE